MLHSGKGAFTTPVHASQWNWRVAYARSRKRGPVQSLDWAGFLLLSLNLPARQYF